MITQLKKGSHDDPDEGMCLLEACSFIAGEEFTDHPICVSLVLGAFGRIINDRMPDDETRSLLIPLIPKLLNTRNDGKDATRGFMAADWIIQTMVQFNDMELPRIVDTASAQEVADLLSDHYRLPAYAASKFAAMNLPESAVAEAAHACGSDWPAIVAFFERLIEA